MAQERGEDAAHLRAARVEGEQQQPVLQAPAAQLDQILQALQGVMRHITAQETVNREVTERLEALTIAIRPDQAEVMGEAAGRAGAAAQAAVRAEEQIEQLAARAAASDAHAEMGAHYAEEQALRAQAAATAAIQAAEQAPAAALAAVQAAGAAQSAGPAAAGGTASYAAATAGTSTGIPRKVVPYAKLGLIDGTNRLNMTLENWLAATQVSFGVNKVPDSDQVHVAILAAMEGHVQAVCLEMLRASMLPDWATFATELERNFSQQDRKQAAAAELERLSMRGSSKTALETYISKSRALHLAAGNELSDLQRYRYFMRGMESALRELISGLIVGNGSPETFEYASNLALKIVASRQESGGGSATGPMPMEVVSAMRHMGWRPSRGLQARKPEGGSSSRNYRTGGNYGGNYGSSQTRGSGRQGGSSYQRGKPGGSRVAKAYKGKGRIPGSWKPRLTEQERKALINADLCLCCKESTEHFWQNCPKNPDNRGNA